MIHCTSSQIKRRTTTNLKTKKQLELTENQTVWKSDNQEVKEALADVAQWVEYQPANQRVASPIPSWGTCLGCEPGPQ